MNRFGVPPPPSFPAGERRGPRSLRRADRSTGRTRRFPRRLSDRGGGLVLGAGPARPGAGVPRRDGGAGLAWTTPDPGIVGRPDAGDVGGLEAALDRARRYAAAGAELVFVEAPQSADELARIAREFPGAAMANLVEGGKTPLLLVARLQALGFRLVIFPNLLTRVMAKAALEALAALKLSGSSADLASRLLSFTDLKRLLPVEDLLDLADRFSKETHS